MKKSLTLAAISLITVFAFAQVKSDKTIADLKAGITGETTASAKYSAFATKATQEGHAAIAKLFMAASKAESIHAENHGKALESLGAKMDPFKPEFEVKSTPENLQAAIDGESYEVTKMYPQFLVDSKAEKAQKATRSFTWALDTEKKHLEFYTNAQIAMKASQEKNLPAGYAVCPVCGNTYNLSKVDAKCAFCQTSREKFIKI